MKVSILKVIVFSITKNVTNVLGLDTKATHDNTKDGEKDRTSVNMIDTCYKVEKHKGKIYKTSNMSLTELEICRKRKFVFIKIDKVKIKLQLDTGSDITITNEQTWKNG